MDRQSNGTRDTIQPPVGQGPGATDPGLRELEREEELRDAALDIEHPGVGEEEPFEQGFAEEDERAFPQQGEARARAGLKNFVVQRPLVAIAGALAAGFILGRILSR